jgi:hypothetical protein
MQHRTTQNAHGAASAKSRRKVTLSDDNGFLAWQGGAHRCEGQLQLRKSLRKIPSAESLECFRVQQARPKDGACQGCQLTPIQACRHSRSDEASGARSCHNGWAYPILTQTFDNSDVG